jgi:hypothetical protein
MTLNVDKLTELRRELAAQLQTRAAFIAKDKDLFVQYGGTIICIGTIAIADDIRGKVLAHLSHQIKAVEEQIKDLALGDL